jgi:AcrR family transcriptional regulator
LLVKAAESVLRDNGYYYLTARKVADRAGVTPQLLYYYFRTMDDLTLAIHEKITQNRLRCFEEAIASVTPLRALWSLNRDPAGAIIASELAALANHRPKIRAQIVRAASEFRSMQIAAVASVLERHGVDQSRYPAASVVTIASALARTLVTDMNLGIPEGYDEAVLSVERALQKLEPV